LPSWEVGRKNPMHNMRLGVHRNGPFLKGKGSGGGRVQKNKKLVVWSVGSKRGVKNDPVTQWWVHACQLLGNEKV